MDESTITKCPRCEKVNPQTGKFCLRCGLPLDTKTAMESEEKRKEMDNIMTILLKDLLKDPEIQTRIENKLKQMEIGMKS
jgi:predicted amidophosphoribosyltransferase